jgi:hypothetical protein
MEPKVDVGEVATLGAIVSDYSDENRNNDFYMCYSNVSLINFS